MTKIKICGLKRDLDIEYANETMPDYAGFVFAQGSKRQIDFKTALRFRGALSKEILAVGVFVDESPDNIAELLRDGAIDIVQLHGDESLDYIRELKDKTNAPIIKVVKIQRRTRRGTRNEERTRDKGETAPSASPTPLHRGESEPCSELPPKCEAFGNSERNVNVSPLAPVGSADLIKMSAANVQTKSGRGVGSGASECLPFREIIPLTKSCNPVFSFDSHSNYKPPPTSSAPPFKRGLANAASTGGEIDYPLFDSPQGGSGKTFDWNIIKGYGKPFFLAGGINIQNIEKALRELNPFCIDISGGVETDGFKDLEKMREIIRIVRQYREA